MPGVSFRINRDRSALLRKARQLTVRALSRSVDGTWGAPEELYVARADGVVLRWTDEANRRYSRSMTMPVGGPL